MIKITNKLLCGRKLMVSECRDYVTNGVWAVRKDIANAGNIASVRVDEYRKPAVAKVLEELGSSAALAKTGFTMDVSKIVGRVWKTSDGELALFDDRLAPIMDKFEVSLEKRERGLAVLAKDGERVGMVASLGMTSHEIKDKFLEVVG